MAAGSNIGDTIQNALPTWLGGSAVTSHQQQLQTTAAAKQIEAVGSSPGASVPAYLSNDAPLVNGKTYTLYFSSDTVITADVVTQALTDAGLNITSPFTSIDSNGNYGVTFTYEGDGTDTVSQYANAIQAQVLAESAQQGAGALFTFIGAPSGATVGAVLQPVIAKQVAASGLDQSQLANQANAAAKASDTAGLTSTIFWLLALAVGIYFVLASKTFGNVVGNVGKAKAI